MSGEAHASYDRDAFESKEVISPIIGIRFAYASMVKPMPVRDTFSVAQANRSSAFLKPTQISCHNIRFHYSLKSEAITLPSKSLTMLFKTAIVALLAATPVSASLRVSANAISMRLRSTACPYFSYAMNAFFQFRLVRSRPVLPSRTAKG